MTPLPVFVSHPAAAGGRAVRRAAALMLQFFALLIGVSRLLA